MTNECKAHVWGSAHDNDRVICIHCECSPMSAEADEPCCVIYVVEHTGSLEEFQMEMARLRKEAI